MLQISDLSPIHFVNTFTLQVSADPKRMGSRELQNTRHIARTDVKWYQPALSHALFLDPWHLRKQYFVTFSM